MSNPRMSRLVFREAQSERQGVPVHPDGVTTTGALVLDGRLFQPEYGRVHDHDLGAYDPERGSYGDPERAAYADKHGVRWPQSQTSWMKHLKRLCGDKITKSKTRTVAKRLDIEMQVLGGWGFTRKYGRLIPDLNRNGGLPDDRWHELPEALARLTGQDAPTPVRLYRLPDAAAEIGWTEHQLSQWCVDHDQEAIQVGADDWRITEDTMRALRRAAAM